MRHGSQAFALQLLKAECLEPTLRNKRSHCSEKPVTATGVAPARQLENPCAATKTQHSQR